MAEYLRAIYFISKEDKELLQKMKIILDAPQGRYPLSSVVFAADQVIKLKLKLFGPEKPPTLH